MNGVCAAVHFPWILIAAATGFVGGFLLGRHFDKVKESLMSTTPGRTRLSTLYDRLAPFLVVACLVASTYASISTYHQQGINHAQQVQRDKDQASRTATNQLNAVVACQNANESRRATVALWNFLFGLSDPHASAKEKADTNQIQVWIQQIYRDHDCTQLDKKYPLPDPPAISNTGR